MRAPEALRKSRTSSSEDAKFVNVFAVEGSDEGLVELGHDRVGHFIAAALNASNLGNFCVHVPVVGEELDHGASAGN